MSSIVIMGILDTIASRIAEIEDFFTSPVETSLSPYLAVFGTTFYLIVWFLIEGMIYMKTDSIAIVASTSFVFLTLYAFMFVSQMIVVKAITFLLYIALAAALYKVFVK